MSEENVISIDPCPKCGGSGNYVAAVDGKWQVISCRCGYNAPGMAVAGTQTPPENMRELQDYAAKATAELRAELSRVHHEKEDALDRLSRTEQNVAALKAELKNVKRMWKETIDRQKWIPVTERLPEMYSEAASTYVDVAYRIPGSRQYLRGSFQYWKEYGWVMEWKAGNPKSFDDYGYVVDCWKPFDPLPEPPK